MLRAGREGDPRLDRDAIVVARCRKPPAHWFSKQRADLARRVLGDRRARGRMVVAAWNTRERGGVISPC
jgi:hypothetical protein